MLVKMVEDTYTTIIYVILILMQLDEGSGSSADGKHLLTLSDC